MRPTTRCHRTRNCVTHGGTEGPRAGRQVEHDLVDQVVGRGCGHEPTVRHPDVHPTPSDDQRDPTRVRRHRAVEHHATVRQRVALHVEPRRRRLGVATVPSGPIVDEPRLLQPFGVWSAPAVGAELAPSSTSTEKHSPSFVGRRSTPSTASRPCPRRRAATGRSGPDPPRPRRPGPRVAQRSSPGHRSRTARA